jgi:hypothetical protein
LFNDVVVVVVVVAVVVVVVSSLLLFLVLDADPIRLRCLRNANDTPTSGMIDDNWEKLSLLLAGSSEDLLSLLIYS